MAKSKGTVKQVMEEIEKPAKKPKGLVAYADFELDGERYAKGDVVSLSKSYKHDSVFDMERKVGSKGARGMAFTYEGEPLKLGRNDDGTQIIERVYQRVILPIEEA